MLSKKTQYAFKALTYMAEQKQVGPFLIAEILQKKRKSPLSF
jgi:DNA-binding IscR family transcriptional regulator